MFICIVLMIKVILNVKIQPNFYLGCPIPVPIPVPILVQIPVPIPAQILVPIHCSDCIKNCCTKRNEFAGL